MKIEWWKTKIKPLLQKAGMLKYAFLVLLVGVCLMLYPQKKEVPPVQESRQENGVDLEDSLEAILEKIDGAGEVAVLLSLETGESAVYQTDDETETDGTGQSGRRETVLLTDSDGNESPLIVQKNYPIYKGAVVLCQGADSAAVKFQIINAVSDITGLSSNKISVIKMKGN